jgi:hypothetical protein
MEKIGCLRASAPTIPVLPPIIRLTIVMIVAGKLGIVRIIHKQRSCGILPHNREERQDAAATNSVYE